MIYILLAILATAMVSINFREFSRFKLNLMMVIAVNYFVCVVCGLLYDLNYFTNLINSPDKTWLALAALQGSLFISIFYLIGFASARVGVGYTAVLTKISVVIPIIVSHYVFGDAMGAMRWLGVASALVAIALLHLRYLRVNKTTEAANAGELPITQLAALSAVLFVGSGLCDTNFKLFDEYYSKTIAKNDFSITVFLIAGIWGLIVSLIQMLKQKRKFEMKNVYAGIILGVPNYFSIIFLLHALAQISNGAVVFSVNNIGLMLTVSLIGYFYYKERFTLSSWIGIVFALLAIIFATYE